MRTPSRNILHASACFFALLTASLSGCSTPGGRPGQEGAGTQQNHQTIVLARVVCTNDMPDKQRPTCDFYLESWRLDKPDGKLNPSPDHERVSQRSLSKPLREQGWFYTVMDPGSYCLKISPATDTLSQPVLYLSVPADKQLVYAGTLIFHCELKKSGKKDVPTLTESYLSDESENAKTVVANTFPALGIMTPRPMVWYDSPGINSNQLVNAQGSQENAMHATAHLKGDNWYPAEMAALPLVYTGTMLVQTAGNGSGDGAAYVAVAGGALLLIAAPIALTTEGITAAIHRKRWAPYEAALQKQVPDFHFEDKLQQALANRLAGTLTNSTALSALQLEAQVYRIILHGDQHQYFNLEVSARVRLCNPTNAMPLWEHDYLYAYDAPDLATADTYQTFISSWYGQHRLEEYQGDPGNRLVVHELQSAVGAITDEVIGELYERNTAPVLSSQM